MKFLVGDSITSVPKKWRLLQSNYSNVKYDIQTSQCFVEGTSVLTNEGNKPIEEIRAGDLVYATNPETGESGYKEVLRTFRKESDVLIHVFVNGEEIETTAVHPFWVENRWVSAKDLKEGDMLTLAGGSAARIAGVYGEKLDEAVVVYNFEVEEFHTYYVTDTGVLVHNANQVGGCGVTGNKADKVYYWIVNTFSDNFFKVIFPILYWCLISQRGMYSVMVVPVYIIP